MLHLYCGNKASSASLDSFTLRCVSTSTLSNTITMTICYLSPVVNLKHPAINMHASRSSTLQLVWQVTSCADTLYTSWSGTLLVGAYHVVAETAPAIILPQQQVAVAATVTPTSLAAALAPAAAPPAVHVSFSVAGGPCRHDARLPAALPLFARPHSHLSHQWFFPAWSAAAAAADSRDAGLAQLPHAVTSAQVRSSVSSCLPLDACTLCNCVHLWQVPPCA